MEAFNDENLVKQFYAAFQQLDYSSMNRCYSEDIVFFDPMFEILRGHQVRCMWKMLCSSAKDFELSYGNVSNRGEGYYTCDWEARYLFSKTGRPVHNKIKAYMKIENGAIVEHSDAFSLHAWAGQALGLPGKLFGWNRFFQRRMKNSARQNLLQFINKQQETNNI